MGLHKILRIVALILAVVGIVALLMELFSGNGLNMQLYVAYITLALTLFIVLVYVLKETFSGNLKKTLMSLGAFILVIVIGYVLSEGVETEMRDGEMLSASGSKWVGTGLHTFYILAIVAIGSMIYSGIKKAMMK
jgi:type IV secretory pathway VirB2 component (pilin)